MPLHAALLFRSRTCAFIAVYTFFRDMLSLPVSPHSVYSPVPTPTPTPTPTRSPHPHPLPCASIHNCTAGYFGSDCSLSLDAATGRPQLLAGTGYVPRRKRPLVYVYDIPHKYSSWYVSNATSGAGHCSSGMFRRREVHWGVRGWCSGALAA